MPVASDEERTPIRRQARRSGGREGCWSSRSARASLEATRGGGGNVGRGMEAACRGEGMEAPAPAVKRERGKGDREIDRRDATAP